MAGQTTILGGSANTGNTQGEATTRYWALFGSARAVSTEVHSQLPVRDAGTLANLYVYLSANGINDAASAVFTVRKNSADTSITVTYTALQTGQKQDTTNTASVADGDEIDVKCLAANPAGSGTTFTLQALTCEFLPDASATALSACGCFGAGSGFSTASTTRYLGPASSFSYETNESYQQSKVAMASTAKDMWVYVSSNSRTTDVTFKTRINGADGAQSVTYTSLQTGLKEDSTNTDTIASGDLLNFSMVTSTGADSITVHHVGCWLLSTEGNGHLCCGTGTGNTITFGNTRYVCPIGGGSLGISTEASAELRAKTELVARDLQTYCRQNTFDGSTVITLRDNQAGSSVSVTYSTGQTGWKIDSSNSATLSDGDEFCFQVNASASTTGQMIMHCLSIETHIDTVSDTTLTPTEATFATGTAAESVTLAYVATPSSASFVPTAETPAVGLEYLATPSAGTVSVSAPDVAVSGSGVVEPDESTVTVTAPTVTVIAGDFVSPDPAGIGMGPGGSVAVAHGSITKFVSTGTPVRMTTQGISLAHGGISKAPDSGTIALSAPAPSVSHGEAILGVGAPGPLLTPPEVSLAHGGATRSPGEASVALDAPAPNLAIDSIASLATPGAVIAPDDPIVLFGDLAIAVDAASMAFSGSDVGIGGAMTVVLDPASFWTGMDPASVGLAYAVKTDEAVLAMTSALVANGKVKTITPDEAQLASGPTSVTLTKGSITLAPSTVTLLSRCVSPSRTPETIGQTMGTVAYCAVSHDTDAACLVSIDVAAACLVAPEDEASTTRKTTETWELPLPEETA